MRLALDVPGDPAACTSAAADLHELGDIVGAAADTLVGQARIDEADFGGLSGDAFRHHARRLVEPANDLARRSHRLADALLKAWAGTCATYVARWRPRPAGAGPAWS